MQGAYDLRHTAKSTTFPVRANPKYLHSCFSAYFGVVLDLWLRSARSDRNNDLVREVKRDHVTRRGGREGLDQNIVKSYNNNCASIVSVTLQILMLDEKQPKKGTRKGNLLPYQMQYFYTEANHLRLS